MITQKRLKEVLKYNKKTGEFIYRIYAGPRKPGDIAGGNIYKDRNKYKIQNNRISKIISIDKHHFFNGSKLAILYVDGYLPDRVYYINGNRSDDSYDNLTVIKPHINKKMRGSIAEDWKKKINSIPYNLKFYSKAQEWVIIKKVGNRIRKYDAYDTQGEAILVAGLMNYKQFGKSVKPELI